MNVKQISYSSDKVSWLILQKCQQNIILQIGILTLNYHTADGEEMGTPTLGAD